MRRQFRIDPGVRGVDTVDPVEVRRTVLEMLYRGGASHLGSNMSAIEMLIAMYSTVDCDLIRQVEPGRDRILVSKGHCAAATYAVMAHNGIIPKQLLDTYHKDGSVLAGHVSHAVNGVEHSTGALGHGLSVGVGCALGLRSRGLNDRRVLVLCGDGEIQEGSIWEALMLAVHLRLGNLTVLIDNNHISSITTTSDVIDMRPLRERFEGFGLATTELDGHSLPALISGIRSVQLDDRPGVLICNTIKGRDVPFAENEPIWHYRTLTDDLYAEATRHLDSLQQGRS